MTSQELLNDLSPERVNSLSTQADEYLLEGSLFKDLKVEMDRVASIKMFQKSETPDDIFAGKLMLYTNDLWEKKIKRLADKQVKNAQRVGR